MSSENSIDEVKNTNFRSIRILRLPNVKLMTGLGRSSIYSKISEGVFPKPISLGSRSVGWLESDILAWIQQRIELSKSN